MVAHPQSQRDVGGIFHVLPLCLSAPKALLCFFKLKKNDPPDEFFRGFRGFLKCSDPPSVFSFIVIEETGDPTSFS